MIPQAYPLYAVDGLGTPYRVIGWQPSAEYRVMMPWVADMRGSGPVVLMGSDDSADLWYTDTLPVAPTPERVADPEQTAVLMAAPLRLWPGLPR